MRPETDPEYTHLSPFYALGVIPAPPVRPILATVRRLEITVIYPANQSFIRDRAEQKKPVVERLYSDLLGVPVTIVGFEPDTERCSCGCKHCGS